MNAVLRTSALVISACFFVLAACAGVKREPEARSAVEAPPPVAQSLPNPWSELTRKVLTEHCGQCHLGSLPTANRRAMAIYDLSEERWDTRLKPENYPGLTRRVNRQATEGQKMVVEKYVRCARDRVCEGD